MKETDQILSSGIYNDLKQIRWVKEKYPEEKLFNLRDYETEKWYFQYLNAQSFIEAEYKIFKTGVIRRIISNVFFFSLAIVILYSTFKYSFIIGYFAFWGFVLGFAGANANRYFHTNKLRIDYRGFEIDDSTVLYWEDILYTCIINYKFNQKYPVNYLYIILKSGVWYKIDFYRFEGIFKNYKTLPVYIEYFKHKYEKSKW